MSPLSNAFLTKKQLLGPEKFFPLHATVREDNFLIHLNYFASREDIFTDYVYFSSYSDSWIQHVSHYVAMMVERFGFDEQSHIVELASNDGYLLQFFHERGIPCLGVEPAANIAQVATDKGIPTLTKFFGRAVAHQMKSDGLSADLLIGNNVLAHVPDLDDFVGGIKILLKPDGILTMEFPHVLELIRNNQFDTIYHEHFHYFSLLAIEILFGKHGLAVCDVDELSTHGGSLRIYVQHSEADDLIIQPRVFALREKERAAKLDQMQTYHTFGERVKETKRKLLGFMLAAHENGQSIVGYGAPAKGNTLLNYCGIRTDLLEYTVDRSPHKQGLYLPGTHIPVYAPDKIDETKPDYLLILPWNLTDEIMQQMSRIREWGGQFVVPIPEVQVLQ